MGGGGRVPVPLQPFRNEVMTVIQSVHWESASVVFYIFRPVNSNQRIFAKGVKSSAEVRL